MKNNIFCKSVNCYFYLISTALHSDAFENESGLILHKNIYKCTFLRTPQCIYISYKGEITDRFQKYYGQHNREPLKIITALIKFNKERKNGER